jgi:hypothetical protein
MDGFFKQTSAGIQLPITSVHSVISADLVQSESLIATEERIALLLARHCEEQYLSRYAAKADEAISNRD